MIKKTDFIVTAFAQANSEHGNYPIRVIVKDRNGKLREEYLQPDEQTIDMRLLYEVSQAAHLAMVNAVSRKIIGDKR